MYMMCQKQNKKYLNDELRLHRIITTKQLKKWQQFITLIKWKWILITTFKPVQMTDHVYT